mmetsp:Transcript_24073/g.60512  ORF Transcript_24073/g.60512 Transcript_24073/m.60512 type:complete len:491 (-) Transcript_24073:760-2232(-)
MKRFCILYIFLAVALTDKRATTGLSNKTIWPFRTNNPVPNDFFHEKLPHQKLGVANTTKTGVQHVSAPQTLTSNPDVIAAFFDKMEGRWWGLPLPTGLSNGSCIHMPSLLSSGQRFTVELRAGHLASKCTYSNSDDVHLQLKFRSKAAFASGGSFVYFYHYRKRYVVFDPEVFQNALISEQGTINSVGVCVENRAFKVFVDEHLLASLPLRRDVADIWCLALETVPSMKVERVQLSRMPTGRTRDCLLSKCFPTLPPVEPFPGLVDALYINLDARNDRRESLELALSAANIRFKRIPAFFAAEHPELLRDCWDKRNGVRVCAGQIGGTRSHRRALNTAIELRLPYFAIFEDDFKWQTGVNVSNVQQVVQDLMYAFSDWDAIGLSLSILSESIVGQLAVDCRPGRKCLVARVHEAQTIGGIIIRSTMFQQLKYAWSDDYCPVHMSYSMMVDQCWKPLQQHYNFLSLKPQLGMQAPGHSDIEGKAVDYRLHS